MRKLCIYIICGFLITASAFASSNTTYGPTTANDTLWHIASELKPNNMVSVEQVMLAIFCNNEDAFSCSNINALKSGRIIKLPGIDGIISIPKDQAYIEVEKQNRQWKKVRLKQSIKRYIKRHKSIKTLKPEKPKRASPEQSSSSPQQPVQQQVVVVAPPPVPSAQEIAFIAETNSRLEAINAKNSAVQTQVVQLSEKISYLEQNIEQLKKSILESQKTFWDNLKPMQQYADKLAMRLGQPLFTILFVCVVILLLLVLFYLLPSRRRSSAVFPEEEYNLMESKEGIAAKLNLARAYIDMGKGTQARVMLDEVLVNGSPSEQAEAKELLAKICASL